MCHRPASLKVGPQIQIQILEKLGGGGKIGGGSIEPPKTGGATLLLQLP